LSSAYSYFNTASGGVHLFADLDRLEADQGPSPAIERTRELGQRWWSDPPSYGAVDTIFNELVQPAQRNLLQHELRHVHQLAMYPYLYLRGLRAVATMATALHALQERGDVQLYEDATLGARLPLPDASDPSIHGIRQSLYASVARYWFDFDVPPARPVKVDLQDAGAQYLTEQHLLEDEVAVYQYRLGGGQWDGRAFARWRAQLPGDCPTFRLLSRALDSRDLALKLLPLLVYWAYQTTIPMGAFVELIELVRGGRDTADLTDVARVNAAIEALISGRFPPAGPSFDFLGWAQHDPAVRLDLDIESMIGAAFHPCAPHARWTLETQPERLDLIYPTGDFVDFLQQQLPAPAILVRVNDSTFGPGSIGFSLYPHSERFPNTHGGIPWREVVLNLEYVHDLSHVIFIGTDDEHACPHRACPHRSVLCRDYPFVPRDWTQCGYPQWLAEATGHEVDRERLLLRKVSH
jgi:hypothetical protein